MATKKTSNCGRVLELVRSTYPTLTARCKAKWPNPCGEFSHTDILHDTILRIMHDEKAQAMESEAEFVKYFKLTQNRKSELKLYANYQTFKRDEAEAEEG